MKNRKFQSQLFLIVLGLTLVACENSTGVHTGQFIDEPVSGGSYSTATQSGITDAEGRFKYKHGETVRFFIGATDLGEPTGKASISLFDLVLGAEPVIGNDKSLTPY